MYFPVLFPDDYNIILKIDFKISMTAHECGILNFKICLRIYIDFFKKMLHTSRQTDDLVMFFIIL